MRVLKLIAAVALPLALFLVIALPYDRVSLWAQLPPPNPLTAPRPVPSAPAQLPPPVPAEGLPSLAVVPSPASPSPTPSLSAFNCSCFGRGTGTNWMGLVSASGYFAARQSATSACLSYEQRSPTSPAIPLPETGLSTLPTLPPGFQQPGAASAAPGIAANQAAVVSAARAGQQLPGSVTFFSSQQLAACAQCTCD
jgi:hypothetical protein